ncbi:unnamed protein product [Schistosoma curassoni]|uniref:Uncharacterized protein n=1 Tax=Schistosoma curassoni TaxID=6186 RepID=A0A183JJY9_9TREM|nr:unnamed protein product [Schistosoma curassoni]
MTKKDVKVDKIVAHSLTFLGKEAHILLKTLAYPEEPISLLYATLKELLLNHVKCTSFECRESATFHKMVRRNDQKAREFILELQKQPAKCPTLDTPETSFSRPRQQHASSAPSTDGATAPHPDQQTTPPLTADEIAGSRGTNKTTVSHSGRQAEKFVRTLKADIDSIATSTFNELEREEDTFLLQHRNAKHPPTNKTSPKLLRGNTLRSNMKS